jgi:hypothetical protein
MLGNPLSVTTKYLFDSNDPSSNSLLTRIEAWLNFNALKQNWFGDESLIVQMDFTFMPESKFLDQDVDDQWQTIQLPGVVAVYHHDKASTQFTCYIMLNNDDLKFLMDNPKDVETEFRTKLTKAANKLGSKYHFSPIPLD